MPLATPVPPGTILENRYDVVRFIGHGGFGRTYLVRDQHRFNELCVLKEFAPQASQAAVIQKAEELFQREAGTLYKLSHPQIPEFRALSSIVYDGEKMVFLVEQFIDGHNYGEWVEQGHCLTAGQGLELLRDLLPVLSYIHGRGVIHRDISPDNLMYDRDSNKPILIDFGSVKQVTETALRMVGMTPATQIHKPGYTPFEQIKGEAYPNSDLYALAVTLLVLMTGKPPTALYNAHTNAWHWQAVLKLDGRFENVLHRMLARHTSDRYESADAVLAAIEGLTIGANPLPPIVLRESTTMTAGRSKTIATPTIPPEATVPAAIPAPPQTLNPNPAFSTIKTVAVAPAWRPPPPTQIPQKAQPPVPQALPAANPGYAAHSPAAPMYQPPAPEGFAEPYLAQRGGNWFWRMVGGTLWFPFRVIGWGFKLLWGAIRLVDKMFTWIFRLIMIVLLVGGAAIAAMFGLPNWSLPSLPGGSSSATDSQGCRDLEGRSTRSGLGYAKLNQQVNEQFYKRHPQVRGRALTNSAADQMLRDDWCEIADDVLRKAER